MAWETRHDNRQRYYYRSRRTADGKVEKQYLGKGRTAELAAASDQKAQAERKAALAAWREQKREQDAIDAALKDFCEECSVMLEAALVAAGYYLHRGEWRRRSDS
jgi:hypothetical protein